MMTEKYPTWLIGHVKEWAQKRLPTMTLCSTTGNELLGFGIRLWRKGNDGVAADYQHLLE